MIEKKAEVIVEFSDVSANPTLGSVIRGAAIARDEKIDCVIGLGGGSGIDTTKGIAAMAVNEGDLWDYTASGSGSGKTLKNKPLPVIAIPTTAGTGTEGNKTAVITDPDRKEKIGIRTDFAKNAFIDPELTLSVPPALTAVQGFDAFCHCFEAFVSVKATPMSDMYAAAGMRAIYRWLPSAFKKGNDIEARYHVSLGSMLGGIVIYLSSCTSAHTIEHMLSGYNPEISHGLGLAMIFDRYHRIEAENCPKRYAEAAGILGIGDDHEGDEKRAGKLLDALSEWKASLDLHKNKLSDFGFSVDKASEMVRMTHHVGGGPLTRDRYRLSDEELEEILIGSMG